MSGCTYTLLWPMKANCDLMSSSAPIRLPIQMLEESPLVSFFRIGGHLDNSNGQLALEFVTINVMCLAVPVMWLPLRSGGLVIRVSRMFLYTCAGQALPLDASSACEAGLAAKCTVLWSGT